MQGGGYDALSAMWSIQGAWLVFGTAVVAVLLCCGGGQKEWCTQLARRDEHHL